MLWRFRTGSAAFGIHIDEDRCWVGNQAGDVYTLSHGGDVLARYSLPDGVKCLVADDFWIYAGCDDGTVYDLSSKVPFGAYTIAQDVDIFWLDIHEGVLHVSDANGGLTVIDHEDEHQWSRKSAGQHAWMVRADERAVFHGHGGGVTAYAADGTGQLWHATTPGGVLFGWQEEHAVYAGTVRNRVQRLSKATGATEASYVCDASVYSCATSPDGRHVFAGDSSSSVYCFDADGQRLWKLGTGGGSALSMQYLDGRLYLVTTDGSLVCVDASEQAIAAAQQGTVPAARDVKSAAACRVHPGGVGLGGGDGHGGGGSCGRRGGGVRPAGRPDARAGGVGRLRAVERAVSARDPGGRRPVRGRRAACRLGGLLPGPRRDPPAGLTSRRVRFTGCAARRPPGWPRPARAWVWRRAFPRAAGG